MGAVRSPEALLLARGPLPSGGLCHPISGKSHQTGEPWHLLCHGGKTPANRLSLERPRALWARFGVQRRCSWREARCRAAVCVTQSAGSHTRPASRGTCCATAVKPRPIAFPSSAPRPMGAVRSPEALLLARGPLPSGGLCHPISGKSHQTGEPWHLLCHGGKTPANRLPLERPRALWARSGVQGHCPWGVAHETADGYVAADDHP